MGLPLPDRAREVLAEVMDAARGSMPGARWVPPENLHATIAFIGSVPDDGPYRAAVRGVQADAGEATLGGLGAFPSARRARVVWVGLVDDGSLAAAAEAVWSALEPLGYAREDRPFRPHITLARCRAPIRAELTGRVEAVQVPIAELVLFASHLGRPAPRYEPLERLRLSGT